MTTQPLYREQPYLRSFSAKVLNCTPAGEGRFAVQLHQTCFYPEGGGQPGDSGQLGSAKVLDTRERNGALLHDTDAPLAIGETVEGSLDWPRRFSLMQHHTAEHIVSGLALSLYKLDNVGFHMGSAMVTIDFNGELDAEAVERLELLANRIVFANVAVETDLPGAQALEAMTFRSKKALSSLEGEIRIVTVPEADRCACCGIHVGRTGEIGCIRLVSAQRYKGGTRVGLLCGEAALADSREKERHVLAISQRLSAKQPEVTQAVERLLSQNEGLRLSLTELQKRFFALRAQGCGEAAQILLLDPTLSPGELRLQAQALLDAIPTPRHALVLAGEENEYRYALGVTGGDARTLSAALHQALGGKGGGNAAMAQGSFQATYEQMKAAFASCCAAH